MEKLSEEDQKKIMVLLGKHGLGLDEFTKIETLIDQGLTINNLEEIYNMLKRKKEKEKINIKESYSSVPFNVDETLPDYFFYSLNYPCKGVFQTTKKMLGWKVSCQQDVVNYYNNKMMVEELFGKEFSDIFSILEIRKEKNIIELNEILGKEGMEKTSFLDYLKFYKTYRKDPSFKGVKIFTSEEIFNEKVSFNIQRGAFLLPVMVNGLIMFQPLTNNLGIPILKFPANSLILVKKTVL